MVFTPPSFPPFAGDRNPLAKGSSTFLTKPLFNSLYDPFGSPCRGQKPQEREDVTALLGARNRFALRLADQSGLRHVVRDGIAGGGMGTAWEQIPTKVRLVVREGSVEGVFKFVKGF